MFYGSNPEDDVIAELSYSPTGTMTLDSIPEEGSKEELAAEDLSVNLSNSS
jgi:hypothetical protein